MAKKFRESTCKHAHCGERIYFSDFTGTWCHWSNAAEPCPNNTVAEQRNAEATYGTGVT